MLGTTLFALLTSERSSAQSGFAGTWTAAPARVEATVTTWGADCGTRPQSYTGTDRPNIEVRDYGAHLALTYPDRTLFTNRCWSPNVAITVTSTTASDTRWHMECRTPPGDARKEVGKYTVTAKSRNVLELIEESAYDWRLNESHCVAKVRIVQRLARSAGAKREAAGPDCVPGEVTRVRLRPNEARIAPGERVCFQPRGFDAEGCARDLPVDAVTFRLEKPATARALLQDNCFRAAASAAEAEGHYRVIAQHGSLRAEASVIVAVPDLSDITARRSSSAATAGSAAPNVTGGLASAGVKAVAVNTNGRRNVALFVAAFALVLLGVAGSFVARRRRSDFPRKAEAARESGAPPVRPSTPASPRDGVSHPPEPASAAATPSAPSGQEPSQSAEALICPTCRRGFAPATARCSVDGTPLLSYSEYARRAREAETPRTPCPVCGASPGPGAAFCGECGSRLST